MTDKGQGSGLSLPSSSGSASRTSGDNSPISVSKLSQVLKEHVEQNFSHLSVRGEVSGVKVSRLGHLYFTLKDDKAVLDAVCWSGILQRLRHQPEDGLEVIAHGSITTYPSRSRYQLVVRDIESAGTGALLQLLERRKKKLAGEGIFSPARKRILPLLPRRIAVFTSEQGAVWQDIRQRLAQRCPVNTTLFPVAVQGREGEKSVLRAFALLEDVLEKDVTSDLQVVIVARGGGSIEDLWLFNEESIVRAAIACRLPVVSAIGHESDWTLLDHAADLRAPTPSAAIELVVPDGASLRNDLRELETRARRIVERCLEGLQSGLYTTSLALPRSLETHARHAREHLERTSLTLRHALGSFVQSLNARLVQQRLSARWLTDALKREGTRLAEQQKRQQRAIKASLEALCHPLLHSQRMLDSLSFQRVLERGYAIVQSDEGIVHSATRLHEGQRFDTLFADRSVLSAIAQKVTTSPSPAATKSEQPQPQPIPQPVPQPIPKPNPMSKLKSQQPCSQPQARSLLGQDRLKL